MSADAHNRITTPESRSRRHHSRSDVRKWIEKLRTSRSARRRVISILVICAFILTAFLLGFYYLGPALSSGE